MLDLGPRDCGKTATLQTYFADKQQNTVYMDCRTIDARSPRTFTYALIMQILPKVPLDAAQAALALLPALTWRLAATMAPVGTLDGGEDLA